MNIAAMLSNANQLLVSVNNRPHYWYLRRVMRCNGNREVLRKALALEGL